MKVAIILHGHVRTWEFCKENIVNTMSNIYQDFDVHWMVGFWNTDTKHNAYDFLKSKNQNVIMCELFNSDTHLFTQRKDSYGYNLPSHLGRWYIRQKLGLHRRYLEIKNNFKYEIIVYIRPDVCFVPFNDNSCHAYNRVYKIMSENQILRTRYQLQAGGDYTDFWNHGQTIRELALDDLFTVTGSLAGDLFDHCYTEYNDATALTETYKLGFADTHLPTATYFTQHSITSGFSSDTLRGKLYPIIIRPHVTNDRYNELPAESSIQFKFADEWKLIDIEQKKEWCLKSNIDFRDYGIM